jgi:hypothetical protein
MSGRMDNSTLRFRSDAREADTRAVITVEAPRIGLDRRILVSNLVSGALCLSPLLFFAWPLFLIGAAYIAAGSVFFGAVYAHDALTARQEALAWAAPWLVAGAVWALVLVGIEFENTVLHYVLSLCLGLPIATPCYLVWQGVALTIRQFLSWRSGSIPQR